MMWNFATPEDTERRLREHGFDQVETWLEPKPVSPEHPREFMRTVTLGPHLAMIGDEHRSEQEAFIDAVAAEMDKPLTLDYVRLNIQAVRPDDA
jgi:hypothetical protein